jgi:hypothetical protein
MNSPGPLSVEGAACVSTATFVGGTGPYRTDRGDAIIKLGPLEGPHQVTVNLVLNP